MHWPICRKCLPHSLQLSKLLLIIVKPNTEQFNSQKKKKRKKNWTKERCDQIPVTIKLLSRAYEKQKTTVHLKWKSTSMSCLPHLIFLAKQPLCQSTEIHDFTKTNSKILQSLILKAMEKAPKSQFLHLPTTPSFTHL